MTSGGACEAAPPCACPATDPAASMATAAASPLDARTRLIIPVLLTTTIRRSAFLVALGRRGRRSGTTAAAATAATAGRVATAADRCRLVGRTARTDDTAGQVLGNLALFG